MPHRTHFIERPGVDSCCTPPPPVVPPPLSFPRGGAVTCSTQNFSLQLTVLLWQNHHPRVLPKAFQWKVVSMCKSSRSIGAGPRKFTPSWSRTRSRYIGSPLNVSYAEFFRFMLQFLCLQMCVYGGSAVPQGGRGGRHLVTVPQGVVGDRLPYAGEGQGGGVHEWVASTSFRQAMSCMGSEASLLGCALCAVSLISAPLTVCSSLPPTVPTLAKRKGWVSVGDHLILSLLKLLSVRSVPSGTHSRCGTLVCTVCATL